MVSSSDRVIESNRVVACNKNQPGHHRAVRRHHRQARTVARTGTRKKFLELVIDNIPICLTVQSGGRPLSARQSQRGSHSQPRRREDAIGLSVAEIFDPKEGELIAERDAVTVERQLLTEEQPISAKDGLRMFVTRRQTVVNERAAAIPDQDPRGRHRPAPDRVPGSANMAYHDGLTELPNRAAFLQALTQMIEACHDTAEQFAVLSVDLDGDGNRRRVRPRGRRQIADRGGAAD